jgi:hypothetical protein
LWYQPGVYIYRLVESNTIFAPKYSLESSVFVNTHSPPAVAKIIGIPTYSNPNVYTVSFRDGSIAEYTEDLLSLVPSSQAPISSLLPHWVKDSCNATLFLSTMPKPRHGILHMTPDNQWIFQPGNTVNDHDAIMLSDLEANCQQLLETGQLFRGHAKFKHVFDTRNQISLRASVLRHVSAHGLQSLIAPFSLKNHSKLSSTDKAIWDLAYDEEYDGLTSLPSWEDISEDEYCKISKGRMALPTMAIATIKFDAYNKPKCAKYRLVVLGNLDYHTWSQESTAAPVLSQLELRLLTSLAVHHRCVLKNCGVKQAFVQSKLPENEVYFLKPPPSCPRSKLMNIGICYGLSMV